MIGEPRRSRGARLAINNAANDIDSVRDRVATNGLEGTWSGSAADALRDPRSTSFRANSRRSAERSPARQAESTPSRADSPDCSGGPRDINGARKKPNENFKTQMRVTPRPRRNSTRPASRFAGPLRSSQPEHSPAGGHAWRERGVRQTAADAEEAGGNISPARLGAAGCSRRVRGRGTCV